MIDRPHSGSSDPFRQSEPLPPDFSDVDRALDAQIEDLASRIQVPAGLTDRIFAASRTLLPGPAELETISAPLRFTGAMAPHSLRLTRRVGARLATAAAVGLLAVVTWWSTWQGTTPQPGSREALGPTGSTLVTDARFESRDVAWHAADALDAAFDRISTYLVASEEIRSTFDVETELVNLFPELASGITDPLTNHR